jgi:predicted MFS family arabinose efflux permease
LDFVNGRAFSFLWLMRKSVPKHILPVIVFAQFTGTSLWFAGNAVVGDLIQSLGLEQAFLGHITMAVQGGFIAGTLLFAFLNIADRYSPVLVFLICSLAGSAANISVNGSESIFSVLLARFMTGFFLAGIYPVGMKIASDWHKEGLGKALGYLVGALVVGTAFPHLLSYFGAGWPWESVFIGTSILASAGGLLLFLTVPDGPHHTKSDGFNFRWNAVATLFKNRDFRSASFGYFGHMWELYTFWAYVPVLLTTYSMLNGIDSLSASLWSFIIIAIGGIGCAVGGHISIKRGSKVITVISLAISGFCALLLPLTLQAPMWIFLILLLCWGFFVIPDSPQFSAMVAASSETGYVATGLTIVNSIGFAITILSIQWVNSLWSSSENPAVFLLIAAGPLVGLLAIRNYGVKAVADL